VIELLAVVVPPPEAVATARPGGIGLVDRAVRTVRSAVPGASVIVAGIDADLVALLDSGRPELVLLVDSTFPLVPAAQLAAVCEAARPPASSAVAVAEMTDTLKMVDGDGVVTATVERGGYRVPVGPLAVTPAVLASCLSAVPPAGPAPERLGRLAEVLDRLVGLPRVEVADQGRVACRVIDGDGAGYAEALLASSAAATATSAG
jgi:hypothetical protein